MWFGRVWVFWEVACVLGDCVCLGGFVCFGKFCVVWEVLCGWEVLCVARFCARLAHKTHSLVQESKNSSFQNQRIDRLSMNEFIIKTQTAMSKNQRTRRPKSKS